MAQIVDSSVAFDQTVQSSAQHVIAGFRYQLLQSVAALIGLGNDEELLLEVFEDFSIATVDGATDVQVKNSQAVKGPRPFSLQSSEIGLTLQRFWQASNEGALNRRLVFLARGGPAMERDYSFPNSLAGLLFWRFAAMDAVTLPLRTALIGVLPEGSLRRWIVSEPSDSDLRSRLLRRVQWELKSQSAEQLVEQLRDQIGELYHARNLPAMAGKQALRALTDLAFETAAKPDAAQRRLSQQDLVRTMDDAAATMLLVQRVGSSGQIADLGQTILVSDVDEVSPYASRRVDAVERLSAQIVGQPLAWIHGANGVGKSTMARLLAHRLGGRWIELDLRPVQREPAGSLAAWRELARFISLSPAVDGVIIDDFDGAGAAALRSRLSGLARLLGSRGARMIVTSHHEVTNAFLLDCGSSPLASVQAPYFTEDEIVELVGATPAPEEAMVLAWSVFIGLTTGGGHPLLAVAKISGLRARGWPTEALAEDLTGGPSDAVRVSREEARRTLLKDLSELDQARSLDAGQLLRRIGCVFDRVDEGLIRHLTIAAPSLSNGGDALSVLKGAWIDRLAGGDLRVSPLISDIVSDVPPEQASEWRCVAAEYWLSKRVLDAKTLPLCFWNAYLGDHTGVLMLVCNVIETMPKAQLRAAAALLSPMTVLVTDKPLHISNPAVAVQLRLLQFEVADAMEEGPLAGRIARRLMEEVSSLQHPEIAALTVHISTSKFLMAEYAAISAADRVSYALALREAEPMVRALPGSALPDAASLLPPQFKPGMDMADLLFSMITQHIGGSTDELEAFTALDSIPPSVRDGFIDAMAAIFEGHAVFVHSGWSRDQLENRDMAEALRCYDAISKIVAAWSRPDVQIDIECARSIILDEGLKRREEAISVIDAAMAQHGASPTLLRQKSKVLGHAGRHQDSTDILVQIEDQVGRQSPFDRSLALRDGAISAAKADRFDDALRLIDKALTSVSAIEGRSAWKASFLVEKALMLWRANRRDDALVVAAAALESIERFTTVESRQAERTHQYARAIIGLLFGELGEDDEKAPPFSFGDASVLESDSAELLGAPFRPLADQWRVLAAVEASIGADVGIDSRSMAKQNDTTLVGATELLILKARYEHALMTQDTEVSLRLGAAVVWAFQTLNAIPKSGDELPRIEVQSLTSFDPTKLLTEPLSSEMVQGFLLDAIGFRKIVRKQPITGAFLDSLEKSSSAVFGAHPLLKEVIETARGARSVSPESSMPDIYAYAMSIPDQSAISDPGVRFYRDMMTTERLGVSLARRAFLPAFISDLVSGWIFVLEHQRFRLRFPAMNVPTIKQAIRDLEVPSLSRAASLLLAVAPAVGHTFASGWRELLEKLATSGGGGRIH